MPTLPSKQELKSMTYRDLQRICKDWGVRANLKTDEMIDLLLETQSRNRPLPAPTPQRPVQSRSVSTRRSTRTGPARLSSVIIHDVSEETTQKQGNPTNTRPNPEATGDMFPVPRTKKVKELQKRLGVGRPVAVGGTGPRAVTRSTTISSERLRSNRSMQKIEATIQEELETSDDTDAQPTGASSQPGMPPPRNQENRSQERTGTQPAFPDFQRLLSEIVKPLQDQIQILRAEVKRLQSLETEVQALGSLMRQTKIGQVDEELRGRETAFGIHKRPLHSVEPSTPSPASTVRLPSDSRTLMPSPHITTQVGVAPVLLGKRQREYSLSDSPVTQDEDHQGSSRGTSSPARKRPKFLEEALANKGKEVAREEVDRDSTSATLPRVTSFVVYNDPEEGESSPSNNHLPEYYTSRSGGPPGSPRQGRSTTSATASENRNTFNFSLLPEPSTPGPLFLPAFPYPEPPQSPTPAGASLTGGLSKSNDRSDVFKTFGLPPPDRARRLPSGSSNNTVDPAAISRPTGKQRHHSTDEPRPGFSLTSSTSGESNSISGRDPADIKKTMYGTELEGDTRFGDFGVEGVAMGFWTGSHF